MTKKLKYKLGDRVLYKGDEAIITEVDNSEDTGLNYYIRFDEDQLYSKFWVREDSIKLSNSEEIKEEQVKESKYKLDDIVTPCRADREKFGIKRGKVVEISEGCSSQPPLYQLQSLDNTSYLWVLESDIEGLAPTVTEEIKEEEQMVATLSSSNLEDEKNHLAARLTEVREELELLKEGQTKPLDDYKNTLKEFIQAKMQEKTAKKLMLENYYNLKISEGDLTSSIEIITDIKCVKSELNILKEFNL